MTGCSDDGDGPGVLDDLFLSDSVLNIAHRGGALLAPEETLEAFQNALDVGADALELDLHSTSDGVIICLHDDTVDRTTNGTGEVTAMTFEELRGLDAGYTFSTDDDETFPFRGSGLRVPSFEEVLDAFPNEFFVIEIKQEEPSIITNVIDLITARDMMGQVILASMTDTVIAEIRDTLPDVHTSFATGEMVTYITMTESNEATYEPPARFVQIPHTGLEETLMARALRFDLKVHAWTVNDREDMEELIELGVDGLITDDPATLREVLDR